MKRNPFSGYLVNSNICSIIFSRNRNIVFNKWGNAAYIGEIEAEEEVSWEICRVFIVFGTSVTLSTILYTVIC